MGGSSAVLRVVACADFISIMDNPWIENLGPSSRRSFCTDETELRRAMLYEQKSSNLTD